MLIHSSSPRIHRLPTSQPPQLKGTISSPFSPIPPNQYNHNLNGFQQAPISKMSTGSSGAPRTPHEHTRLSSISSSHNDSLTTPVHPPRNYNRAFHSTSSLAIHHGIPQSLPPPPHTIPSSEPELNFPSLVSNYLTMLASNRTSEDHTSAAAGQAVPSALSDSPDFREPSDLAIEQAEQAIAASMSTNNEAAVQAIASALSASSPDFLNSSDFLAPPVSPWDDLLTTPALDADVSVTPDIYTSPALMGFGDDFDNPPSLFGGNAYDGYDTKASMGSSLSPSELPLPDIDDMYTISPGTPAIDTVSPDASPFHVDDSSYLPTRRKNVPTGTRKNTTPESLVPYDAPIQTRKYRLPSTTSRKDLPATFARKRARTQGPGGGVGGPGPTLSEEDVIKAKRLQNTLAARRSRKRKLEYQHELEDAIENERKEKETWRARTLILETLLRDKGHESPKYLE